MAESSAKVAGAGSTGGLFFSRKDLDSSDMRLLEEFHKQSAAFPHLLSLESTLQSLSDFSCLWFREQYLDITKATQFPVQLSFPWMLMEKALDEVHAQRLSVNIVVSVLEIYNDAAHQSLATFQHQFLCDEVEAEARLCFEQMLYHLTNQVYDHYKNMASAAFMDAVVCEKVATIVRKDNPLNRLADTAIRLSSWYEPILSSTAVVVVNQEYNVHAMIASYLELKLARDLDACLIKLEASDTSLVMETRDLLRIIETTHKQLSTMLPLASFTLMKHDTNCSLLHDGRIFQHVQRSIVENLGTNYAYNAFTQRFRHIPLPFPLWRNDIQNKPIRNMDIGAKSDSMLAELIVHNAKARKRLAPDGMGFGSQFRVAAELLYHSYRGTISLEHIDALHDVLRPQQVDNIVQRVIQHVNDQIHDMLRLCIPALGAAIPPFKFPRFMYRVEGCFGFFEGKFKHLLESDELAAHVFQILRQIGNGLSFLLLLSDYQATKKTTLRGSPIISKPSSIFAQALQQIHESLYKSGIAEEWNASYASMPSQCENAAAFYFVWNALEFVSCLPDLIDTISSIQHAFGDGVTLAGCTILHLLHQRRQYDLWNVCQHVIDVQTHETIRVSETAATSYHHKLGRRRSASKASTPTSSTVGSLDQEMAARTRQFLTHAHVIRQLSAHVFTMLEQTWIPPTASSSSPEEFVPPVFQSPEVKERSC